MHLAALTDIAWLPNAQGLLLSSTDGYCSLLLFEPGALGTQLPQASDAACLAYLVLARCRHVSYACTTYAAGQITRMHATSSAT